MRELAIPVRVVAVAATTVGRDRQPRCMRIARPAQLVPPAPDALDGEGTGVGADADTDLAVVGGDVVDAIGGDLAKFGILKSCTRTGSGSPLGRNSRPLFIPAAACRARAG
jgi:hypothetical protein